jgi:hypothetical protein
LGFGLLLVAHEKVVDPDLPAQEEEHNNPGGDQKLAEHTHDTDARSAYGFGASLLEAAGNTAPLDGNTFDRRGRRLATARGQADTLEFVRHD